MAATAWTSVWNLVTVTYNSEVALRRHWGDVILPPNVRWTVVDNASSDSSAEVASELGATVIRLNENVGFGAANNVGASSFHSDYIAFVNPDVTVDPRSLLTLESVLVERPTAIVGPQLVDHKKVPQASGRSFPTVGSKLLNRLRPNSSSSYRIFADHGELKQVSWLMGAAVAMRLSVFEALRWDERYFVYYEDADIGLRAWAAGNEVLLSGDVRWELGWARETSQLNVQAWKYEMRSAAKFYGQHPHLVLPVALAKFFHPERRQIGQTISADQPQARASK